MSARTGESVDHDALFPALKWGIDWRLGSLGGYVLIGMCSRSIARTLR